MNIKMEMLLISYSYHLIGTQSDSNHRLDTWRQVSNYTLNEFHLHGEELFLIFNQKMSKSFKIPKY